MHVFCLVVVCTTIISIGPTLNIQQLGSEGGAGSEGDGALTHLQRDVGLPDTRTLKNSTLTPLPVDPSSPTDKKENKGQHTQHQNYLDPTTPTAHLSICLLVKDDNDILAEWIAYHYHAVKLRHLIIAVDPASQTTPTEILQRFTKYLPDFTVDIWSDKDYMPSWFTATTADTVDTRQDNRVPKLVPQFWFVNASTSPFHQHIQDPTSVRRAQLDHDYNVINQYL